MNIIEVGYNHRHDRNFRIHRPLGTGNWLFLIIKSFGLFTIKGEVVYAKPGTVLIFSEGTPQQYSAADATYVDDWMHFLPEEDGAALLSALEIPLDSLLYLGDTSELSAMMQAIWDKWVSGELDSKKTCSKMFLQLLSHLADLIAAPTDSSASASYSDKLTRLRDDIYAMPEFPWNIDQMAKQISLSRSRLQHLYSETFETSIIQDIIESRLCHSCDLLAMTELRIQDIAVKCGYSTASYFMRCFKARYSVTPTEFRQKHQQQPN